MKVINSCIQKKNKFSLEEIKKIPGLYICSNILYLVTNFNSRGKNIVLWMADNTICPIIEESYSDSYFELIKKSEDGLKVEFS